MKKELAVIGLLIFSLVSAIYFSHLTLAQTPDELIKAQTGVDINKIDPNKVPSSPDEIKQTSESYLRQEWTKLLNKSASGRALLMINTILSPVFKLMVGFDYSLSWIFTIALFIWIVVFILISKVARNIFETKEWVGWIISAIIPTLAGQAGTIKSLSEMIAPIFTNPWIIVLAILVTVILLVLYSKIMKRWGAQLKEAKKKEDESRREEKAKLVEKINDVRIDAMNKGS
jgi:uncharacterized membrane protein